MHLIRGLKAAAKESGQVLILLAICLPILLLSAGFAIDFGCGFLTRARLAKASDAAALAVMRNLGRGQAGAEAIGQSVFATNFSSSSSMYVSAPTAAFTIVYAGGEPVVTVASTATIRTFFIKLAGFTTLTVADSSQATRPPVILSLVIDKSGSMNLNGGAAALPPSVTDFLSYFIEGTDQLGEISFSTDATQDVAISTTFHTPIENSLSAMAFGGATFAQGGLLDANTMVTGVPSPPANAAKVVVFFTDGWANMNQDPLPTTGSHPAVNYGGCAPAEFTVGWCNGIGFYTTGGAYIDGTVTGSNTQAVSCNAGSCSGANTFPATDTAELANPSTFTIQNIADEADYRAVQLANTMRASGITVYSIGLGDKINATYLQELANDPASPVYNASEPSGLAEFAPTASDLDTAFQTIASKILLRLTQ
jgi:Flp pilus assembly protein TadG